jgi:type IX secretion system PorP/SprF family membrane protein
MRKIILSILIVFCFTQVKAQSRQFYHQYMLNPGMFNPANMDIFTKYGTTFVYSNDFMGSSYSPLSIGVNSYYNYRPNQGFGATIINDNFGKYNQLEIAGNAAYKTFTRSSGGLSMSYGLRLGLTQRSLNTTGLYYESYTKSAIYDPVLGDKPSVSAMGFNVGAGFALVTPKFDLNVSLPAFIGQRLPSSGVDSLPSARSAFEATLSNFMISAGYKIRFDSDWYVFYPTMMVKGAANAPIQAGADLNFLFNQLVFAGVGFRSDMTIASNIGVFLDLGWRFVYSYQNALLTQHPGTGFNHEFTIGYARTIPDNPFNWRKFTNAKGEVKDSKKILKIKMPRLRFLKKLAGKMKYD